MFAYKALHPRDNLDRLYMQRKNGGRGLIGIQDCVAAERRTLDYYLVHSEEELLQYVSNSLGLDGERIESKEAHKSRLEAERKQHWKSMPLHGQFENETTDLKTEDSWIWLSKGDLKRETESLLIAAQDQALATNSVKHSIYNTAESNKCRLCGTKVESVTHIISACSMLAQKNYKRRHDMLCKNLHWNICKVFELDKADKWYQHVPSPVMENDKVKLLYDFTLQTDREIHHRKPDLVLLKKESRDCFIVDVAIPGDHRIDIKEVEKIDNYSELRLEISRMWNVSCKVIPVVIGALGSTSRRLQSFLNQLDIPYDIGVLQKSALLGTANILRKVLDV